MCLAVPGAVIKIDGNRAVVDFSGVSRAVDLSLVPDVKVGDYVLVHAGCAIQIIPADDAIETLKLIEEYFTKENHE